MADLKVKINKNKNLIKIKKGISSYSKEDVLMMEEVKEKIVSSLLDYQKNLEATANIPMFSDKRIKNKESVLFFSKEISRLLSEEEKGEREKVKLFNFYSLCKIYKKHNVNLEDIASNVKRRGVVNFPNALGIYIDFTDEIKEVKFIDFSFLYMESDKENADKINKIALLDYPLNFFIMKDFGLKLNVETICYSLSAGGLYWNMFSENKDSLDKKFLDAIFKVCREEDQEKLLDLTEKENYFFKSFKFNLIEKITKKLTVKELKVENVSSENVIYVWNNIVDLNKAFNKKTIEFWSEQFNELSDENKYKFLKGLTFSLFDQERIEDVNLGCSPNNGYIYLLNLIEGVKSERKVFLNNEFMKRWVKHGYCLHAVLGGVSSRMNFFLDLNLYKKASENYLRDNVQWFFKHCGKENFEEEVCSAIKDRHFNISEKSVNDFRWNVFWNALKNNGVDLSLVCERNLLSQIPLEKRSIFEKSAIEKSINLNLLEENLKDNKIKPVRF